MKHILQFVLTSIARMYIWRFRSQIIAVTGSVGKTSTTQATAAVLAASHNIRTSGGNLNNELGVPLTILGDWKNEYYRSGGSAGFWLQVILTGLWGLVMPLDYPEILIIEYAADRPGDIRRLAKTFSPDTAVVTAVGDIPVHVEYFSDPDAVAKEKSQLIRFLKPGGRAVLNHDDPAVLAMPQPSMHLHTTTFGFNAQATIRVSSYEPLVSDDGMPQGVSFKLHVNGTFVPVRIMGSLGHSLALAAAAAAAVGRLYGMHLEAISQALGQYRGPAGRLRIIPGIKQSVIIDDTYNASPAAMHVALDTLKDITAIRRARGKKTRAIAVLGDMLELGKYTFQAHQNIGNLAADMADILVCVGDKARVIADAAANQMTADNIMWFETSDEAKLRIQALIQPDDTILVKGSQGKRMEKIVKEIMAEPERAPELLVRQSKKWLDR